VADANRTPRQQEIIDRTATLIHKGGLGGLTMKAIGGSMGISDAALYRHFPTKEALLLGVLDQVAMRILDPLQEILGDHQMTASQRLHRVLAHHMNFVIASDGLPILVVAEASTSGSEAVRARVATIFGHYFGLLQSLCGELDLAAKSPDPELLAMMFLGLPAAVALRQRVLPDPMIGRRIIDELIPFLLGRLQETER